MIEVVSVIFASSVNLGANNYEFTSIDTNRDEHQNFSLLYDHAKSILWIIDRTPALNNSELLKQRRFSAVGTPNIRSMRLKDVTEEVKKHFSKKKPTDKTK